MTQAEESNQEHSKNAQQNSPSLEDKAPPISSSESTFVDYDERVKLREDKVQDSLLNMRIILGRVLAIFIIVHLVLYGLLSLLITGMPVYMFWGTIADNYQIIRGAFEYSLMFFQDTILYILLLALATSGGIGNRIQEIILSIKKSK